MRTSNLTEKRSRQNQMVNSFKDYIMHTHPSLARKILPFTINITKGNIPSLYIMADMDFITEGEKDRAQTLFSAFLKVKQSVQRPG